MQGRDGQRACRYLGEPLIEQPGGSLQLSSAPRLVLAHFAQALEPLIQKMYGGIHGVIGGQLQVLLDSIGLRHKGIYQLLNEDVQLLGALSFGLRQGFFKPCYLLGLVCARNCLLDGASAKPAKEGREKDQRHRLIHHPPPADGQFCIAEMIEVNNTGDVDDAASLE